MIPKVDPANTQSASMHNSYRPDVDGLRAIAVIAVVVFHAFPKHLSGGFAGVDVFFVISGFLITGIIHKGLNRGDFEFSDFWARRIRRIFPALLTVTIATLIAGWWYLLPAEFESLKTHIKYGLAFAANFKLNSEVGYFDLAAELKPLLHLWSLAIEEQFYLFWPVLLWVCFRRRLNLFVVSLLLAILSYQSRKYFGTTKSQSFYFPWTRFWELQAGALLALWNAEYASRFLEVLKRFEKLTGPLALSTRTSKEGQTTGTFFKNVASITGISLILWSYCSFTKATPFPSRFTLFPVLGAVLIIAAGKDAWFNKNLLSLSPMRFIGNISFPLYLWHWPILSIIRITKGEPSFELAVIAVAMSFTLSILTYYFVEQKLRFNSSQFAWKAPALTASLIGVIIFLNFSPINPRFVSGGIDTKIFEHALGQSISWYQGKGNWLFLGNAFDNTVAKLKLTVIPKEKQLESTKDELQKIAIEAFKHKTKFALIIGPNKESIYPEFLPDVFVPSEIKYIQFYKDKLSEVPHLTLYDPTADLLASKNSEGLLYWRTDTHWNNKGAFIVYTGFSRLFDLPVPAVEFQQGKTRSGDLIGISKLQNFPLEPGDNWEIVWKNEPKWTENELISDKDQEGVIGKLAIVTNEKPLADKTIWVVGDSFTNTLRQYFNATFREVRYIGHWSQKLSELPKELATATNKPDMIVVVRVERSF